VAGVAWALAAGQASLGAQYAGKRGEVVLPDATRVSVEIAKTEAERQRGLMFRKSLDANGGMIFVFEEPDIHAFWMKNTLISLDMLWLDRSGKVVWIAEHVPPCQADPCPSYSPGAPSTYVLEVNAGFAKKHGVKLGDVLRMQDVPSP
jgi:hypothetical protein